MNGHGLRKTSSPKFVVPQVSEHESGLGVEHGQAGVQWVVDAATRGQLDDQVGGLPDRHDRLAQQSLVERRRVLGPLRVPGVADMQVDHRGAGLLAPYGGLDQLVGGGGQRRYGDPAALGSGGGHGDQGGVRAAPATMVLT